MKFVIIIVILLTAILSAKERPKIALVLSGGGARGGAHVGVLRILEEKNIPIDLIVGTSMGSFVGGLYASGKTPDEIDEMLTTTVWEDYIRSDFNREDTPMRQKSYDYQYNGRIAIGINDENEISLPTGMLNRQPLLFQMLSQTQDVEYIRNFDDLPIPFRAIATDISNGKQVILSSGSLSKSIYASSSIPGGLQPIVIDGKTLIDGGVSDNIPITLAKKMGADIIIAVDVSEHFNPDLKVNSYFSVLGQLVNILMRKNADMSIATLGSDDVLITPDLDGFGGLDAHAYAEIIQRGADVTSEMYDEKLKHLSISDEEYAKYRIKYRKKPLVRARIIDEIIIENHTSIGDDSIRDRLKFFIGDEVDESLIRDNLLHLYNMTIFDSIDYQITQIDAKTVVTIIAEPSWNSNGDIHFAIALEDDFEGHSGYRLKLGYTMYGINELGAEWRSDGEVGQSQKLYTEFFQPLDSMQRYYITPSFMYEKFLDILPAENLGNQELQYVQYQASLAVGAYVTTDYQFEIGLSVAKDNTVVDIVRYDKKYDKNNIYALINVDNLDNYDFPAYGIKSQLKWYKYLQSMGSDYEFSRVSFEVLKPFSYKNNSLVAYFKAGSNYDIIEVDDRLTFLDTFELGGLFNLSGYQSYSFFENNVLFGYLKYRYRIKDGGFFGSMGVPLYVGVTAESGLAWSQGDDMKSDDVKYSASVYVAADTFLGAFYLAYGYADLDNQTLYLYLGEKF